jgi:YihY family inner membrane protein
MERRAGAGEGSVITRAVSRLDRAQRQRSWLSFPVAVLKKFGEDGGGQLAALVSYYAFFSLFPLLLLLFTVLGFALSGNRGLQDSIVHSTLAQFPIIGDQLKANVRSVDGSGLGVVVGLVGALWGGLGAMQAAESAMNSIWDVPMRERPNFIEARLRALGMLVVLGGGVLLITLVGSATTAAHGLGPASIVVGLALSTVLGSLLLIAAFKVLTDRDLSWRQLVPGAVAGGIAWAVLQALGGLYVQHTLRGASQTYGLFALVLGLLSWIYLQAQVFVLAAEVNVVRDQQLWPRGLRTDDLTSADRRTLRQHAEVEERAPQEDVEVDLAGSGASDGNGSQRATERRAR